MAYIVSPYAGAAEFPSDNLPAQLLSQGLQAGYARRMKEMENKMKLEEEGKKAFDEAYKYANLDLSKVDRIYHDELKRQADNLAKGMIEAYKQNPSSFKYNTAIADEARRLSTLKTQREAQSSDIQKSMDARRQLEKEGNFDVAFNELGQAYSAWQNATDPTEKAKKQQEFIERYTSGDLNIATPKVATIGEMGTEIKKTVEDSKEKGDKTTKQYLAGERTIKQMLNSNPKNIAYYSQEYKIDPKDPLAVDKTAAAINKEINPARISIDEPRSDWRSYLSPGSVANKKTIMTTVSSAANLNEAEYANYNSFVDSFIEKSVEYQKKKKEVADNGGVYTIDNFKSDGGAKRLQDQYQNLYTTYGKVARQMAEKAARENVNLSYFSTIAPTINPVSIIVDEKKNKYGRPISFSTDKDNVITNLQYMAEKKVDGRTVLEPEASPITAENWIQIRDNYQLQDLIEEKGFKLPKNVQEQLDMKRSPSGGKPAAEKPKGEKVKIKASQATIDMFK